MLPYWYKQMIENKQGRTFQRGKGGKNLVYKHEKFFVIGNFETGYHPTINIRLVYDIHSSRQFIFENFYIE